jgi:hypothetical protein
MNAQEIIQMQVWEYVDGLCNAEDQVRIAKLIANDEVWKAEYEAIVQLHQGLETFTEVEQPSMRFTKNVMEAVAHTGMARPTRSLVNTNIIRGIAAIFIISVVAMLGYAFAHTGGAGGRTINFAAPIDQLRNKMAPIGNSNIWQYIWWCNALLAVVLADSLLRKKRMRHS